MSCLPLMHSFSIGCLMTSVFIWGFLFGCRESVGFWSLIKIRLSLLIHYWSNGPVKNSLISVMPWRNHYQRHFLSIRGNIHTGALSLNHPQSNGCTEYKGTDVSQTVFLTTCDAYECFTLKALIYITENKVFHESLGVSLQCFTNQGCAANFISARAH